MRADDFLSHGVRMKTYLVRLKTKQTGYTQILDSTVQARNPEQARRIIKNLYNNSHIIVGQPRELR